MRNVQGSWDYKWADIVSKTRKTKAMKHYMIVDLLEALQLCN